MPYKTALNMPINISQNISTKKYVLIKLFKNIE